MMTTGGPHDRGRDTTSSMPAMSVVICTYNRADLLSGAMEHVLAQNDPGTPDFELIIVDNNSADGTRDVVERARAGDSRVRYICEPEQGVSHARNAGIAAARAPIIAYTDDDVRVNPDWLASIARTFREHPRASAVGGKVLPIWPTPPPRWLTPAHWGPLALVDHGDQPIRVDATKQLCLLGCSLAVVRAAFARVGPFSAHVQRVAGTVASSEDHEFLLRLFAAGEFGIYDPRIVIHAAVQPERLTRDYHRTWHRSQGHYNATMRPEYLERSNVGRLFDVPAHLYRSAIEDALRWLKASVRSDDKEAFERELRLQFFWGFLRTRYRQFWSAPGSQPRAPWWQPWRTLLGRAHHRGSGVNAGGRP